ncbi:hypothetical protein scyTo_0019892, partial [Scyliorhinus torazame]|nr:hypothetical protein [Scyliorhinus torazame]
ERCVSSGGTAPSGALSLQADLEVHVLSTGVSKEELIQSMDRVDREIARTELQITNLKRKQVNRNLLLELELEWELEQELELEFELEWELDLELEQELELQLERKLKQELKRELEQELELKWELKQEQELELDLEQ